MYQMKITFPNKFNVTAAQLRDGIAQGVVNGYQGIDGYYYSREGFAAWCSDIINPIDGLYVDTAGHIIAVSAGHVYVIATDGTSTVCTGDLLNTGNLCTFAEDTSHVFIGHGGYIAKVDPVAIYRHFTCYLCHRHYSPSRRGYTIGNRLSW
jgi:hypothetical protein